MKEIHPHDALAKLVIRCGSQRAAAETMGISEPYLSDLMRGHRTLNDRLLAKLGLRRIVVEDRR